MTALYKAPDYLDTFIGNCEADRTFKERPPSRASKATIEGETGGGGEAGRRGSRRAGSDYGSLRRRLFASPGGGPRQFAKVDDEAGRLTNSGRTARCHEKLYPVLHRVRLSKGGDPRPPKSAAATWCSTRSAVNTSSSALSGRPMERRENSACCGMVKSQVSRAEFERWRRAEEGGRYNVKFTSEITVKPGSSRWAGPYGRGGGEGHEAATRAMRFAGRKRRSERRFDRLSHEYRHGTPFEHSAMTFFVHAPAFVWWDGSVTGLGFASTLSGRYKVLEPVFWGAASRPQMIPAPDHKPSRPKFVMARQV